MRNVFLTGADRGIGFALCKEYLAGGDHVFAGRFLPNWKELDMLKETYSERLTIVPLDVGNPDSIRSAASLVGQTVDTIDHLVNVAGVFLDGEGALEKSLRINTFGPLRVTEAFLPLMENGEKRLCYFSSEAGSISLLHRTEGYPYCVSKAMLNMGVKLKFNELRPKGYTFRLYHPGWVKTYIVDGVKGEIGNYEPEESAAAAYRQFTTESNHEDVLIMTDIKGEWWAF